MDLDVLRVNFVILNVSADESDVDGEKFVVNPNDQPMLVTAYIEHNAIIIIATGDCQLVAFTRFRGPLG